MECESSFRPDAVGVEGSERFVGLWQIWDQGEPDEWLKDPYLNTVEAHLQYVKWQRGEKARPWPNCPR